MDVLDGKVAIIPGGASGIGRPLGEPLVHRGARVVLADINPATVRETAGALAARGAVSGVVVDVTDAAAVERVVTETMATHGRLDYLFNNAGIAIMGDARYMTVADSNPLIDVKLRGVVHRVA